MNVLLGFDPGGQSRFGWCVAADGDALPLSVLASGLANSARRAVESACAHVPTGQRVLAAAIDAPLVWPRSDTRVVDRLVRDAVKNAGAPHPAGTVQSVNSLRGACLVQGILTGVELRERSPGLPLTEAHPKALIWLCPQASAFAPRSEHERDAALSAFSAWALTHHPPGWLDVYVHEGPRFSPLSPPLHYFMPSSVVP